MTTRRLALAALILLAAVGAAAAWRATRPPPDDEALVRGLLADAALAAAEKRPGDAADALSARFRGPGGLDRDGAKRLVAGLVLREGWVGVSVAGVALALEGDGGLANVDVLLARATGAGKPLGLLLPEEGSVHRFALRLEREDEGWRVVEAAWRPVPLDEALAGPPPPGAPSPPPPSDESR
jgi:hypothetical protein